VSAPAWDRPLSDDEIDFVLPSEAPTHYVGQESAPDNRVVRPIDRGAADRESARDRAIMPDADTLVDTQIVDAVYRLHEDRTKYPKYPWAKLAHLAGPMCPGDLIMIAARTGGGKSLFLQNLFDALVVSGRAGTYVGLEQSPDKLRTKWACLRADIAPRLVMATRDEERGSLEWHNAMDAVQREFAWQKSEPIRHLAHFSAQRMINARGLKTWTEWAVDHGCQFVIVDHIDRVDHGDGRNSFHEMSRTIRLAKELAEKHGIVMLLATQVSRPGDALEKFMPPSLHQLRGGGTKEEESDTVLGVYRPLKVGTTDKDLKAVRQGMRPADTILEPNTMGVMVLKHRLDGPVANKVVQLRVEHQRVLDMPERDQWSTEGGRARQMLL
jgi:replicative DNA helicase